ncbi:MAG: hypothetical protein WC618_03525 [Patescibacteria group bacterium]
MNSMISQMPAGIAMPASAAQTTEGWPAVKGPKMSAATTATMSAKTAKRMAASKYEFLGNIMFSFSCTRPTNDGCGFLSRHEITVTAYKSIIL